MKTFFNSKFPPLLILFVFLAQSSPSIAMPLPSQPLRPEDPGSAVYPYAEYQRVSLRFEGRDGSLYLPRNPKSSPLVLIAFAHGHMAPELVYGAMYEHLARKGFALLYIPYDRGPSDSDFEGMAATYQMWVEQTITSYPALLSPSLVVYSGHSNGALVATMAAGLSSMPGRLVPSAVVAFGLSAVSERQKRIPAKTLVSLVVGDADVNTPPSISERAFAVIPSRKKQLIVLSSYRTTSPNLLTTHGSFRTFGWTGSQVGPLHWYGYWKHLVSAAWDAREGGKGTNAWLYGARAFETGTPAMNRILRIGF